MTKAAHKTDSEHHNEDRRAKMKEAAEVAAKHDADEKALANYKGTRVEGESRDDLLQRIRDLREEPPANQVRPPAERTDLQKSQLELEQEAGRAAVARSEAESPRAAQAAGGKK